MSFRAFASEFPNDNPELHDGTCWICPELRSAPKPLRTALSGLIAPPVRHETSREQQPAMQKEARRAELRKTKAAKPELSALPQNLAQNAPLQRREERAPVLDQSPLAIREQEPSAPVTNERPSIARAEPSLAGDRQDVSETLASSAFQDFTRAMVRVALAASGTRAAAVLPTLLESGVIAQNAVSEDTWSVLQKRGFASGHAFKTEFVAALTAWRDVLNGRSCDLTACGQNTLDCFAAELLAALLTVPRERAEQLRRELRRSGVAAFGMLAAA